MRKDQPYATPIYDALTNLRKKYGFGTNNNVRHRCDCPVCGAKLVNLYFANGKWQCLKCKKVEKENEK